MHPSTHESFVPQPQGKFSSSAMTSCPTEITQHTFSTSRHTTSYNACGDPSNPLILFIHGWPELGHSWRHQLPVFAGLGFYCVAPDMR